MMKPTQQQLKNQNINQKKQTKQPPPPAPKQAQRQTNTAQSGPVNQKVQQPQSQSHPVEIILPDEIQLDSTQESIISMVQEYLLKYNLLNTMEILQKELQQQHSTVQNENAVETELIQSFDNGDYETFFGLWHRYLPYNIRMHDEYGKKLEFYLQIYFLIYDIHPSTGRRNGTFNKHTVQFFKSFLDTRGSELSKTNEFLHFYALPYVQKPQEHQSYKHLFSPQWLQEQRGRLIQFLSQLMNKEQITLIEEMYHQYTQEEPQNRTNINQTSNMSNSHNNPNYTTQLEINNQELLKVIQDYNLKYNQMQKRFKEFMEQSKNSMIEAQQKWYSQAKEIVYCTNDVNFFTKLMKIIMNTQKGIYPNQNEIEVFRKKIDKFEKIFSVSFEELISQSQDISVFERASIFENDLSISPIPLGQNSGSQIKGVAVAGQQQQYFNFQKEPFVQLDFNKIHQLLMTDTKSDTICRVLQALRWRVTKAKGAYQRREVLIQFGKYDIVGCNPKNTILLQRLLVDCSNQVKEYSLRLINAMASDYEGRSYLMESFVLVKTLIDILKKEKNDSLVRRNALGALQKLSLRRKPQIIMIENDVIRWIVKTLKNYLKEKEILSEYSYEYATALFMNLSMRQSGKRKCEDPKEEVLKVLNDLLEHENMQVRTFVNGTLYSLFSVQTLREQARAMGMKDILQVLMKNSDERFIKQIQYIIEQLNSNRPDEEEIDEENDVDDIDDIEDNDDVGEDEETEDILEPQEGFLNGEDLLARFFSLNSQEAIAQNNLTKSMMDENLSKRQNSQQTVQGINQNTNNNPFRPTTPLMNTSQIKQMERSQMPSELKSRPKILRTPLAGERSQVFSNQIEEQKISEEHNDSQKITPSNNNDSIQKSTQEQKKQPVYEETEEFKFAFEARPKIVRTPPDGPGQRQKK